MRYLTENNRYVILYDEVPDFIYPTGNGLIRAYLEDKKTEELIFDYEELNTTLEKCLMKLGQRLIKEWRKTKK